MLRTPLTDDRPAQLLRDPFAGGIPAPSGRKGGRIPDERVLIIDDDEDGLDALGAHYRPFKARPDWGCA